jgi:hypothetical protein
VLQINILKTTNYTSFKIQIMKLSAFKQALTTFENTISFQLPNGTYVPAHFHVTEVGKLTRHFIDCGGVVRNTDVINFQLWIEKDIDHRLTPTKLNGIIEKSQALLFLPDAEIEVEYQQETIGKFNVEFENGVFQLKNTLTTCLAPDACGVPEAKQKIQLKVIATKSSDACCTPGSSCC